MMNSRIAWILVLFGLIVLGVVGLASRWGIPFAQGAETERRVESGGSKAMATPVLVELFTSEGCSSCPPANELLTRLVKEQPVQGAQIIVLGEHVDYWNHLGWRDPFSNKVFSDRQYETARALRLNNVYTPQMVVDGETELLGSDSERVADAITRAAKVPKTQIRLTRLKAQSNAKILESRLDILIEAPVRVTPGDTARIYLVLTEDRLSSEVARGENSGRHLVHFGVVRQMTEIGSLMPRQQFHTNSLLNVNASWKQANLNAVVFVQEKNSRRILGSAILALH